MTERLPEVVPTLRKGAAEPIYVQLQNHIRERIASGAWQPGQAIASEAALAQQFAIARMTVRQALDGLLREGLLTRIRGRGTFVAHGTVERELTRMHGFSEDMRVRGMVPASQLLERRVIPAPAEVSRQLRLGQREAVIYLRRLRLADGIPLALETSYLHYELCQAILDADLETGSLYAHLQEQARLRLCHASQELQAAVPRAAEARLLQIARHQPVLVIRQVSYLQGTGPELPGIVGCTIYRGDRYRFHLEVPR